VPIITGIFAYIAEGNGPEDEGIVATKSGDTWVALVSGDKKTTELLKPLAQAIARATRQKIKLVHFIIREDLEEIT
jgi:hypothetical protein